MKYLHLTLIFSLCFGLTLTAQTPVKRQFDLSYGIGQLTRQDLVFSPFIQRGVSPFHIGVAYQRDKKWSQQWSLEFAAISARNAPEFEYAMPDKPAELLQSAPHSFTFVDFDYHLGKALAVSERSIWTLGAAFSADLDAMNYVHARISNFGYFTAFDLGLYGKWACQLSSRQTLEAALEVPILAWAAHSPYLINDDDFIQNTASHKTLQTLGSFIADGQLSTPQEYQRACGRLLYHYKLTHRWQVGILYQGDWLRYQEPLPLRAIQHHLSIQFSYNF